MKDNVSLKSELLEFALVFTHVGVIGRDITSIYSWRGVSKVCSAKIFSETFILLTNSI